MNILPYLVLCISFLPAAAARSWMGIHSKAASGTPSAPIAAPESENAPPASRHEAFSIIGEIRVLSAPAPGSYLGILEGVRCFDCSPDRVILGILDSSAPGGAMTLTLRPEVWNAIERPVQDRRLYDYGRQCFYFGQDGDDSVSAMYGSQEIGRRKIPCYPYIESARIGRESLARPKVPGGAVSGWVP